MSGSGSRMDDRISAKICSTGAGAMRMPARIICADLPGGAWAEV